MSDSLQQIKEAADQMWQNWIAVHEALVGNIVSQTSEILGLQKSVIKQVTAAMEERLRPLATTISAALNAYRDEMARFFGLALSEELNKLSNLSLQKAGLLPPSSEHALTQGPATSFSKIFVELDQLRYKIEQTNKKILDTEAKIPSSAIYEAKIESMIQEPHIPAEIASLDRFKANAEKRHEMKALTLADFKRFQQDDSPVSFDDSTEYAQWSEGGFYWEGQRSVATGKAEGLCWMIQSNGDYELAHWKYGQRHGLHVYWLSFGYTQISLGENHACKSYYKINSSWAESGKSGADAAKLKELMVKK